MKLSDLDWEVRTDGMYLTIDEVIAEQFLKLKLEDLFVKSGYMNADVNRIKTVMTEARNTPEYVGPKFQMFDKRKEEFLILEQKPGKVLLTIRPEHKEKNLQMTVKDIEFLLGIRKVVHGVDWALIAKMINLEKWDETTIIAQNTLPQRGEDARIIEMVRLDKEFKPLLLSDGSVDFRNLDNIIQVKEDQLLARRIPPKPGIDGMDIFGNPIPADAGENFLLPKGKNTYVNEDLTELFSEAAGYLYRESSNMAVGKLFLVPGDVNFKVGNIRYQGDVIIRGSVLPDFIVEADGNVEIQGTVEAATVISNSGNVHVHQGVFGKSKCTIKAGKNLRLSQAQDCILEAGEDLTFNTSLSDCKITADSVIGKSLSTVLKNCEITAYNTVYSAQIGAPSGGQSFIRFVNKEESALQEQIQDLYGKRVLLDQTQEKLLKHLKSMKKILEKATEITQRSQDEVKKVYLQYQSTKTKLELLDKKIASLNKAKKEAPNFKANVKSKLIHSLLQIEMRGESAEVKDALQDVGFFWENQKIERKGYDGHIPTESELRPVQKKN